MTGKQFALSPLAERRQGGYVVVDPTNPDHIREHCLQAAAALSSWLSRYESALIAAGADAKPMRQAIRKLESPPLGGAGAIKAA